MRLRLARVGVLLAATLGLLGTMVQPAGATTVGSVVFVGTATVTANGIAYPCFGNGVPDLTKCPVGAGVTMDPAKAYKGLLGVGIEPGSQNMAGVTFGNIPGACVGVAANLNKAGKAPAEAGVCTIAAAGVVRGYCGLSKGLVTGAATIGPQNYGFTVQFEGIAGLLLLRGSVTKGGTTGNIIGAVLAVPITGSCLDKSQAKTFGIVGGAVIKICTPGNPSPPVICP